MIDLVLCASGRDEVRIVHDLAQAPASGIRVVRRCADLAETRAVLAAGIGDIVLIDLGVRGLTRETLAELHQAGSAVIGLRSQPDAPGGTSLGLRTVLDAAAPTEQIIETIRQALAEPDGTPEADAWTQDHQEPDGPPSRILAVWGPSGAPGRSCVAMNLAAATAARGLRTVLVDADTHAPSLVQMLGILEEAPGLVAACRAADRDRLTPETLEHSLTVVNDALAVLGGIGVAGRWPEASGPALSVLWRALRSRGGLIIIDCAAPLAEDEDLSYDTIAPQRNAATLSALRACDTVLAVTSADPISLTRLVRERERLAEVTHAPVHVLVNRRSEAVSEHRLHSVLAERFPCASLQSLPEDTRTAHRALWEGALWQETAPRSALSRAVRELAASDALSGGLATVEH